jgi:S-adenosylmethionine hydrolase
MTTRRILTLTTDFGADGPYVAAMKGVVLGRVDGVTIVDVSHTIAPQNVLEGAFVLSGLADAFPPGTVHLAVIDPSVGTDRPLLAVKVSDQWFVLPDNGLITGVLRGREPQEARRIASDSIRRAVVSSTFHGRDILAPAAAFLLGGGDPAELGPIAPRVVRLANFEARLDDGPPGSRIGEILFRDSFGNLVTSFDEACISNLPRERWSLEIAGRRLVGLANTYADHPPGTLIALPGSTGWVEIAVVNGDASRTLNAGPGSTVRLRPIEP